MVSHSAGVLFYEQLAFALLIPALVVTIFGLRIAACSRFRSPFSSSRFRSEKRSTGAHELHRPRVSGAPQVDGGSGRGRGHVPDHADGQVAGGGGLQRTPLLISMFTLGCLFAYLHFRRPRNRVLFGILAIIVPVLANGLRAYVMVLVG